MNPADIAFIIICTGLVMLMTPGLALFYGGLVRSRNVLSTTMHSFITMGIVPVLWFVVGYSLAFGPDLGGIVCYVGVLCKNRLGYDDALDVVGIHGVGGTWGALATGIFAVSSVNGVDGLLYGNPGQLWVQFVSVVGTWGFVYVASLIILRVVDTLVGLRVAPDPEIAGLDMNEHNERAYQI